MDVAEHHIPLELSVIAEDDEPCVDPARPALRFVGQMRGFSSIESVNRGVTGVVRLMPSGDIRWSSVSNYVFLFLNAQSKRN